MTTTEEILIEVGLLLYCGEMRRRVRNGEPEAAVAAWADAVMATASARVTAIESAVQASCN